MAELSVEGFDATAALASPQKQTHLFLSLATSDARAQLQQLQQQQSFLEPGHNLENLRIPETEPVGSIVHTLRASDRFNKERRFSYHMTGDTFSVNEETGEIRLVKPLDRERQSQVVVVVSVFDVNDARGDSPVESKRRNITIEDLDDSKPVFASHRTAASTNVNGHLVYQVEIGETAPVGSIVLSEIQVSDADEGLNADVVFECRPGQSSNAACELFSIEARKLATGRYSVTVRTQAELDYERNQSYRMSLYARGKRPSPLKGVPLASEAVLVINVLNVQDEGPVFANAPYSLSMFEGLRNGSRLLNLIVQDGDAAPQRDLSLIVVPGPFSEYFQVSRDPEVSKLWYLETNNTIDRENPLINDLGNVFTINLLAAELDEESGLPVASERELIEGMSSLQYARSSMRRETVTVLVLDLPDSRPLFVQANTGKPIKDNLLVVNVSESLANGSALPNLNLAVQDLDQGVNSRFNLSLMDVELAEAGGAPLASQAFALQSQLVYGKAEVVVNVINSSMLDYEQPQFRSYRLNLVASKQANQEPPLIQILELQLNLLDTNDNWPEFEREQFVAEVAEGAAPGTLVAHIKARDRDSNAFGRLEYSLRGHGASKFRLVSSEGKIIVGDCGSNHCLDYESQPSFSLTYEARDGGGRAKNVSLIINVLDLNDHPPKFTESVYKRELISDNLANKQNYISPQLIVRATDDDGPSQGRNNITYKMLHSNLTGLDVDPQTGLVYLSEPLDLEGLISSGMSEGSLEERGQELRRRLDRKIVFEAQLAALDNGTPPLNSTAKIQLTLKGNRDGAPKFKQDFYQAFVRENHPLGKAFYQVQAVDPDEKDSQLRYSLGFDLNDMLSINAQTGELAFKSPIDYDHFKGSPYNVTVLATDNSKPYPLTASASLSITIQDVNDKPPKFLESEYKASLVQGRSRPGELVLEVQAFDRDKSALLNYSILSDAISLRDRNGQELSLEELVNSSLGYLSHLARSERTQMANSLRRMFHIDSKSGAIELRGEPDYSFASSISLPVRVQDLNQEIFNSEGGLQEDLATCTFYLQTEVGRSPFFAPPWTTSRRDYNLSILEELPLGTVIFSFLAREPSTSARIENFEKVLESDPRDLFQVSRLGVVSVNKRIDYEELPAGNKRLSLSVKALTSDVFFSTATLNIQLLDLNDNAPQFVPNSNQVNYTVTISEASKYPQEIMTLRAEDKDSSQFGQVHYYLSPSYSSELFSLDPKRGVLSVRKGAQLDRETEPNHWLQVLASDCNETAKSLEHQDPGYQHCQHSSVNVNVILLDENDNEPHFLSNKSGHFEALVSETAAVGSLVAQVQASDPDEGPNGQVSYEIVRRELAEGEEEAADVSRLLRINRDGLVTVGEPLSGLGRNEPYKVSLRAFDQGKSNSRQSFAHLLLTISDVVRNDGVPRFLRPRPDESVELSEQTGPSRPVYQVHAIDPDQDSNGKVMYKFAEASEVFDIDPFSGLIRTQNRPNFYLDREQVANYTLIIIATDLGTPPKQASQVLSIKISDVNDNEPFFERAIEEPPLVLLVEEEQGQQEPGEPEAGTREFLVGTIRAVDKDTGANALIGYEIIEGNANNLFRLSYEPDEQALREGNNPCSIYSTGRLDREARESYTLTIRASSMSKLRLPFANQVKDPLGGRLFNQAHYNASDLTKIRVTIKLLDINDNKPLFAQQNAKSIVDSGAEVYSQLMAFKAFDADSSSSEIHYSILDVLYYSDSKYNLIDEPSLYHLSAESGAKSTPLSMKYAFDMEPRTGILRNTISLRAYIDGYFELFVKADSGARQPNSGEEPPVLLGHSGAERSSLAAGSGRKCAGELQANSSGQPFAEMENCHVAVARAALFVTHQRETFRFVFNKTKLNDRLDEFKRKLQASLEEIMFEPSQHLEVRASQAGQPELQAASSSEDKQQLRSADKIFLSTFNTEFYERSDGSLDFSTLTSCSQLVKFDDNRHAEEGKVAGSNQVMSYEEVLSLLRTLNGTQTRSNHQKGALFAQYGLVNIERCPPDKTLYRMSPFERLALYLASMIAIVGSLLALLVSRRRKNYERKLRLLQRSKYQIELMCGSMQNMAPISTVLRPLL